MSPSGGTITDSIFIVTITDSIFIVSIRRIAQHDVRPVLVFIPTATVESRLNCGRLISHQFPLVAVETAHELIDALPEKTVSMTWIY